MSQSQVVFLLEEKSAKAMLEGILNRVASNICPQFIIFEGKQDLKKGIKRKVQNYKTPNTTFFIMCDQDNDDCQKLKQELLSEIKNCQNLIIRIACKELESFYLGDLSALSQIIKLDSKYKQGGKNFREPDQNGEKPSQTLQRITKQTYQKIKHSREISRHLNLEGENKSHSFNVLLNSLKELSCN